MTPPALQAAIVPRLITDYGFRHHAPWLQQGRCPACGKKELFTHAQGPWVLRCGRANHCGWVGHLKDIYRDLFDDGLVRFPSLDDQPQAAADAYLQYARGFDLTRIRGWYTQEYYYDAPLKIGSVTVRFAVGETFWERLIDQPARFGKKAHFKPGGCYAGRWWQPPTLNLSTIDELWLVEGIFDAIALDHHGIAAVALLSCNNYPEQALAALAAGRPDHRPRLIWALDSDRAGQHALLKGVRQASAAGWTCDAAQIPSPAQRKLDWNDVHQRERLSATDLDDYRYHGALLIAETAFEKALLIHQKHGLREFPFDYGRRLYWFKLDTERFERACEHTDRPHALQEASTVLEIANCWPRALYYQANVFTDEAWYYFRVDLPNGQTVKNTFTGAQLACASEFKKRLLTMAPGAFYTGNSVQLDRYLKHQMTPIRSVETMDFVGYSREHGAYVFNEVAVKQGQVYERNAEDFFELGQVSLKTLNQSVMLTLQRDLHACCFGWLDPLWQCFGAKGFVVLAFWFGTLFAEQIRAAHKSFPFLEMVGEPGAGKSTLIEFLWKLFGRADYEGFDPSKSSLAARARNFAQVANLPVVLIEGERSDESKYKTFDWDELKTAYNGRSVRAIGVKNSGNDTREPPFRGALVISQNTPVAASEAMLQRLIQVNLDRIGHTLSTKAHAEALERWPLAQVSDFLLAAVTRDAAVLQRVDERLPGYERQLQALPQISSLRIAKNHAQIMALMDALTLVVPISADQQAQAQAQLVKMAIARQQAINADHPMVQEFWETFDYLDGNSAEPRLNHAREPNLIAVNLNHFATVAVEQRQQIPALIELKRYLKTSKVRRFVDIKPVRSVLRTNKLLHPALPEVIKCWVFQRCSSPQDTSYDKTTSASKDRSVSVNAPFIGLNS